MTAVLYDAPLKDLAALMMKTENEIGLVPSAAQLERAKRRVAASSVLAAVVLAVTKVVAGVLTGSLGILSEAAHSGLDLVAAAATWLAVRVSGRPADGRHTYGHGKVENLSALLETALLLVTCVWIIWEAAARLLVKQVHVEANVWAFAVMILSIVVNISRSRALRRVARQTGSQALEADALHFSTDIWSSGVVICGLIAVRVSALPRLRWLVHADAVAALGVALIVVVVSVQLGRKTIADLIDEVPPGLLDEVRSAIGIPGVTEVERVRVRRSGPQAFADVTLIVPRDTSLTRAHDIATRAELAIRALLPGADVVVHVEPLAVGGGGDDEDVVAIVRRLAAEQGLAAHELHVYELMGQHSIELHLEVDADLSVAAAHEQASTFEQALRVRLPGVGEIVSHLEPRTPPAGTREGKPQDDVALLHDVLLDVIRQRGLDCHPHNLTVQRSGRDLSASFHCVTAADMSIAQAHALTDEMEQALRARLPELERVTIHVEPPGPPSR